MKRTKSEIFTLAILLGQLPDDVLIDTSDLSILLCLTPNATRQAAYRNPDSLPQRFGSASRHLRWRLGSVRDWIKNHDQGDKKN